MTEYSWKLWYDDESTFSDLDGEVWESPRDRVVVVTQRHPGGKDVIWNENHYLHHTDGRWSGHDLIGMVDQTVNQINQIDCHRLGWDMPTPAFKAIVRKATLEMRGK